MTNEQIEYRVTRLHALRYEYLSELAFSQDVLRAYVLNKDYPLDDRFEIWEEWCEKEYHDGVINNADVPLIGAVVTEAIESDEFGYTPDRYCDYDWNYFLDLFEDPDYRERFKVTVGDVKEMLIKTNFKGYTHDW